MWSLLLPLLVTGAAAAAVPACKPGAWGPWSRCETAVSCSVAAASGYQVQTNPLPITTAWDQGRVHMTEIMQKKLEYFTSENTAARTFPEWQGRFQCEDGMAGEIPCNHVEQLGFVDINQLGYDPAEVGDNIVLGNDCWGWTDPVTWDEYAIICLTGGTSFVRITDPTNPFTVGMMYTHTTATIWRDIKVIGNWAYVVSEAGEHGMQVFDLTRLRGVRNFMSHMEPDAHYNMVGNAHNIVANEETNYVYIVGATQEEFTSCAGGLHAVDVSNPLNPRFAGCYADDGYTHDAQCIIYRGPDARYFRREICFSYNEDSLTIVDMTDKDNMQMISKRTYDGVMYSHQGWLSEDQSLLLLDDELDEWQRTGDDALTKTYIWDITNLRDPIVMHVHEHYNQAIDHNQYIRGQFSYQANYESGLRIMYVDQGNHRLHEVAFFDIIPSQTTAGWRGAWSVYPFFRSGTVIVSTLDFGLFIVRPDYVAMEAQASAIRSGSGAITLQGSQTRSTEGDTSATCEPQTETKPCVEEC